MKFLFNLLADESDFDESALKFISWKDFDKAIESDTQLFMKLIELGKEHRAEQFQNLAHEEEPMIHTLNSGPGPGYDQIFYRTQRTPGQPEHLIEH